MHEFCPAQPGDSRGPCPGLNTLANHGILPRDGKNLTISQLAHAMKDGYNISLGSGYAFAIVAILLCGNANWRTVDLHNLARAGRIEHRASLVHADAPAHAVYAPTHVDAGLLNELLEACPAHGMDFEDFVRARARRDAESGGPLGFFHSQFALAEAVAISNRFRDAQGSVPKERLRQFLGEERFPDGWKRPEEEQTLMDSIRLAFD